VHLGWSSRVAALATIASAMPVPADVAPPLLFPAGDGITPDQARRPRATETER